MCLAHTEFFNLFKDYFLIKSYGSNKNIRYRSFQSSYAEGKWILKYLACRPILRPDVNKRKPCVDNRPNYILL